MMRRSMITAGLVLALCSASAWAQATAPAPTGTMAPAGKMSGKPRTAKSIECSSKADTQGLHGKPRKTFMRSCKSGKA